MDETPFRLVEYRNSAIAHLESGNLLDWNTVLERTLKCFRQDRQRPGA